MTAASATWAAVLGVALEVRTALVLVAALVMVSVVDCQSLEQHP